MSVLASDWRTRRATLGFRDAAAEAASEVAVGDLARDAVGEPQTVR